MVPGTGSRGRLGVFGLVPKGMEAEDETKVVDRESKLATEDDRSPSPEYSGAAVLGLGSASTMVGRYELVQRLGHGGMATVYLGRAIGSAGFERKVAVKVIHPHLASEPEFVEMFLDEARIAAKIHHPNVVETLDLGEDDGRFFMVMEYVEGETLASLLRQLRKADERLPVAAALQLVVDACRGLAAAHELCDVAGEPLDLVHRDVSPHNLLVSMDGRVKVVDFGIMKAAGKRSTTLTGQLRGKLAYMSPEQARGEPVDARTDIFALGAVLWELCAGERLFSAEHETEVLDKVIKCDVPDIFARWPDLPPELGSILDRALARDPVERYESVQSMLKDVRALARRLEGEADNREVLAATMQRFFGGRAEYLRATMRGSHDRDRALAAGAIARSSMGDEGLTPSGSRGTPVPVVSTGSGPLARSGVRQWSLWLLLPLAGAAIGTAATAIGRNPEARNVPPVQPAAITAPAEPQPVEREEPRVRDPPAVAVQWYFNTVPQGATLTIDGQRLDALTPTSLHLARSEKPLMVRIEKDGFEPRELKLAPVDSDNHTIRLEPVARTADPVALPVRFSAHPKKATAAGERADRDAPRRPKSRGSVEGTNEPDDPRRFIEIPGLQDPEKTP